MYNTHVLSGWLLTLCMSGATGAAVCSGRARNAEEGANWYILATMPPTSLEQAAEVTVYLVQANSPADAFSSVLHSKEYGQHVSMFSGSFEDGGQQTVRSAIEALFPKIAKELSESLGEGTPSGGTVH